MAEKSASTSGSGPLPGGKYEQDIYYRRPKTGSQSGWITVGPSRNGTCVGDFIQRGFEPLWKYGHIPNDPTRWEDNQWNTILRHPDGPEEFPIDQLMTLRWYENENCPVPGTRFPQLQGHTIKVWPCVEHDCERKFYDHDDNGKGPPALANHLRIMHRWSVQDIIALGTRLGINFAELYKGMGQPVDINLEAEAEGSYDCPDCNWQPKADAKKPDVALRMHTQAAHPPLTVEVVSS